ncbi:MAG: TlpA family protein disulfide reductase [Bacteroidetes bacterium]|nr:MAG: TlpA family protein disulfide reductase [Bacteroidota bacterium]
MKKYFFLIIIFCFGVKKLHCQQKEIPSFSFTSIGNKLYDNKKISNKVVVFNFWYPACSPCIQELPALDSLRMNYKKNKNVIFLAVSVQGSKNFVTVFSKRKQMKYDVIVSDYELANKIGVDSYPTNIVINKQGFITFIESGYKENIREILIEEIEKNLKE